MARDVARLPHTRGTPQMVSTLPPASSIRFRSEGVSGLCCRGLHFRSVVAPAVAVAPVSISPFAPPPFLSLSVSLIMFECVSLTYMLTYAHINSHRRRGEVYGTKHNNAAMCASRLQGFRVQGSRVQGFKGQGCKGQGLAPVGAEGARVKGLGCKGQGLAPVGAARVKG